jgi:ubiquinone/menaquinone biosynthesis C-methylase UbiE
MSTLESGIYTHLAQFYEKAGFARFSEDMMPRVLLLAQQSDWTGRRSMDLACGIGTAAIWLAHKGFRVTGVDISSEMLLRARINAQQAGIGLNWLQQDMRALDYSEGTLDLVTSLQGSLNYMQSLGDLEKVFANAWRVLTPNKLFVFDMLTIEGLAQRWGTGAHVQFDNEQDLTIIIRSTFSYESLSNTMHYIIFHREGDSWKRNEEVHSLRGYPIQAVSTALERAGFQGASVLDMDFQPFDPANDSEGRALFVARKPG